MNTICPECSSVFRITAEQLNMAHGKVRCGFCMAVFDALGSLEEDWKSNLPDQNESIEHELVISPEDIEEFNKEPEGSDNPPDVYQDNEDFPLDEIIEQSRDIPDEEESGDNNDSFSDDDEPSALAELHKDWQPDIADNPENENRLDITTQAKNLIAEIENNFRKNDFQEQEEPLQEIAQQEDAQTEIAEDNVEPSAFTACENNINDGDTYEFASSELYMEVVAEDNDKDISEPVSQFEDAPDILRDELEKVAAGNAGNKTVAWMAGILLLGLLFAFQVIYANREEIATHESFRDLMVSLCDIMSCEIPLRNDAALGIKSMVIKSHAINKIPGHPDQLRIKAIFSNSAHYTQAYPILVIKLSGHDQLVTAMRRFRPEEYLAKHIDIKSGLPAKTAIEIIIDIMKPLTPVISYQFDFN